jgi:aldose 1-epimerase
MDNVTRDVYGTTRTGQEVAVFTLSNDNGAVIRLLEIGAIIAAVRVPDRNGEITDVALGFDTLAEYEVNPAYFGCATGRVANRIANGRFELDGETFQLALNGPPNHIHGGEGGFHRALWHGTPEAVPEGAAVRFSYTSVHGEDGYPGELACEILYTLTRANGLRIDYLARTDRATPVNLTNHCYFNLLGHDAGSILEHVIRVRAARYTERDETGIPTGTILPVEGTPLDLQQSTTVGDQIDELKQSGGYDHNFVIDRWDGETLRMIAEVIEPLRGRRMEVHTTQPGVQFYTGNFLSGLEGKAGAVYNRHAGLCLETQHFPDSVNHPTFPSTILRPGELWRQTTEYRFSTL